MIAAMNVILRSLSALTLALVLALTGQTMVAAQHNAVAVGEMEICTGFGIVTVQMDAEGNPTGPLIVCADFASALSTDTHVTGSLNAPQPVWITLEYALATTSTFGRSAPVASARGPPAFT
jgi:hypothetical protein